MKNVIHCYFFISGCVKAQTQGRWMLEPALLPKNVERRAGLQLEIVLPVLEFVANSRRSYTFLNKILLSDDTLCVAGQVLVDLMSMKIAPLCKMKVSPPPLCKPPLANIMCRIKIQVMQQIMQFILLGNRTNHQVVPFL